MTIGWKTLDVGEQALIYNHQGHARIENGPNRLFLWREKFKRLILYTASQNEYLIVKYWDGTVEHKCGPCAVFLNPLHMISISTQPAISLDANEAVIVYYQNEKTKEVTRSIKFGPTVFTHAANEWLHEFRWHGTDVDNKTHFTPGTHCFTKLQVIADQFYYNVDEVRTADDAAIRVKLMMFYELRNVEKMLEATQDPIADFINCICADVIAFVSQLTYMEFIAKAEELNNINNYSQLIKRSQDIGYEILKVVFRGYFAAPALQQTHDSALQARTKLKLEFEQEEQEQMLTDMNLKMEQERIELEQEMEIKNLQHKQSLERTQTEHRVTQQRQKYDEELKRMRLTEAAKLERQAVVDKQEFERYRELKGVGVNLGDYIASQNGVPNKVIRVVADKQSTNLHLHRN